MLLDHVPSDPNVSITASTTADSQRIQFDHDDGILAVTMHMRRLVIVGVYHDIESVLSQNRRHGVTIIQNESAPKRDFG